MTLVSFLYYLCIEILHDNSFIFTYRQNEKSNGTKSGKNVGH